MDLNYRPSPALTLLERRLSRLVRVSMQRHAGDATRIDLAVNVDFDVLLVSRDNNNALSKKRQPRPPCNPPMAES